MSLRKTAFVAVLAVGFLGFAPEYLPAQQETITEIPKSPSSALGEVNAARVNVRSGPADSHYPTMLLNRGDRVVVVGHQFEWLKILPPAGSFSYISKMFVNREENSAVGVVRANNVLVRAGSELNNSKDRRQLVLSQGATVNIIGEVDEFFKITPPEGAYLYIAKRFVTPLDVALTPEVISAVTATASAAAVSGPVPATTATAPVAVADPQPTQEVTRAQTPPVAPQAVDRAAVEVEAEFRKQELRIRQLADQPLLDQPLVELLAAYRQLLGETSLSSTSRRMAEMRVAHLENARKQQEELIAARQQEADFVARQLQREEEARQLKQQMEERAVRIYTAVGQLQVSSVQKDGQPLMRLIDPANDRTLIYLMILDARQRGMIGQFVGVRGDVVTDPVLSVDIITPTTLETVDPARIFRGVTARIFPASIIRPPE